MKLGRTIGHGTRLDVEMRMEKVRECWAKGNRVITRISKELGVSQLTVKQDLIIIRRRVFREPINDRRRALMREEAAAGYLYDIMQLQEMIDECRTSGKKKSEMTQDEIGGDKKSAPTRVRRRVVQEDKDYAVIAKLVRQKLDARARLVELYDLVVPENRGQVNVNVSATATAVAKADINLQGIPDDDIIRTAKSIFGRINTKG